MFFIGIPPYWIMAVKAALFAIPLTVAILLVPGRLLEKSRPAAERLALAGLFAPLLTLFFFHNTAPYFYAFMLPPVVVACAATLPLLVARYRIEGVTIALVLNACLTWAVDGESRIDKQRTILTAAQQMFPSGTAYFDLCYMLPTFTKKNGFMTPWGTEIYLTAGNPTFARAMDQEPVPLIVENDPMFTNLLRSDAPTPEFLPEDTAAMRGSYLPFWGPLWLAGQELQPKEIRTAMIRVPGPYTVTGGAVTIDGVRYLDREVVALDRGETQMIAGSQPVTLWWGENRERPSVTPPEGMFWTGF